MFDDDAPDDTAPSTIVPASAGPYGRYPGPGAGVKSSFGSKLGQIGGAMAKGIAMNSPVGSAVWNAFAPPLGPVQGPPAGAAGPTPLPQPLPVTQAPPPPPPVGDAPMSSAWGQSAPKSPLWGGLQGNGPHGLQQNLASPGAGAAASGNGSQDAMANASAQGLADTGASAMDFIPEMLGGGKLVTQPTLAKIGERGPEAVVPLTPRPGNKLGPDMLMGRLSPPKPPGVHYGKFKSFSSINPLRG